MADRKRLLFIYNPHAGRGLVKANLPKILDIFSASDYELIVHATSGQNDAKLVAEEYTREGTIDRIICAGGDGTLDEVADGVMRGKTARNRLISMEQSIPGSTLSAPKERKLSVGIISAGSANDFGYSLGIPNDLAEAAEKAINGREFECDIASFNGRHFTYTASFGLLAEISFETPQEFKNALGYLAYLLNGMVRLPEMKKIHAKITFDGETVEDDYILGMVVSANSIGGFRGLTGDGVCLDDGMYELMLIRAPKKIGDLSKAVNELLAKKKKGKYLKYYRAKEMHFEFENEVAWALDGENGGTWDEADINVIHKGITYIV